ncbi:MAG: hypothetical protein IJ934_02865, partial [Acetobacter sp.]|nr:hypothetical protein [Acetobacter sp.]
MRLEEPGRYLKGIPEGVERLEGGYFIFGGVNEGCEEGDGLRKEAVSEYKVGWRNGLSVEERLVVYRALIVSCESYEEKSLYGKRPEECEEGFLYSHIWGDVNDFLGTDAKSHVELVEQLGQRYAGRPLKIGDVFCGGGSIPFEAARLGFDVYASDLNPVACMLTWGAFFLVGGDAAQREALQRKQERIAEEIDAHITALGIEHDEEGNRAKAYLYCTEVEDPQTGYKIPLAPSWVISKPKKVIAVLKADREKKRFEIEIESGVSEEKLKEAEKGTIQKGIVSYVLEGKRYSIPLKTLRGDYKDASGKSRNALRQWEKSDFTPRKGDLYQERLYCILWISKATGKTYYAGVTEGDLEREERVKEYVREHLGEWQAKGYVPEDEIETGQETERLTREKGYRYWHQLFMPRQILSGSAYMERAKEEAGSF